MLRLGHIGSARRNNQLGGMCALLRFYGAFIWMAPSASQDCVPTTVVDGSAVQRLGTPGRPGARFCARSYSNLNKLSL